MTPGSFVISVGSFRGRGRRPRIEGALGSIGRVTSAAWVSGMVGMMRATGAAVGVGRGVADCFASGAGARSV